MLSRCSLLALLVWTACSSSNSDTASSVENADPETVGAEFKNNETADPKSPQTAPKGPSREAASLVLRRFAESLSRGDIASAMQDAKTPEGFNEKQIRVFLGELEELGVLTTEDLSGVLEAEFGPLKERFPESAEAIAFHAQLSLSEAFAFGDKSAAALMHWDGQRFRVAALHRGDDEEASESE